jgi:2-succinyl-5-enolpyruvyl-6-hydroxy-3-cyclohexene-1-carboxylate synthase
MSHERSRRTYGENARVADALASWLCAGGAPVVCSPGSRSAPLALAFHARSPSGVTVVLDERAAAFVALGMARASGRPAIALCTSGSAAANFFPAVVEANLGRVPLVVITADRPGELHGCGAPQTMPQGALYGDHARLALALPEACEEITDAWIRTTAMRILATACGSPPGPVQVNVPFREPLYHASAAPACPAVPTDPPTGFVRGRLRLEAPDLAQWAEELAREPGGVLVCGPIAPATIDPASLARAVARLAAALDWPTIADPLGVRFGAHDRSRVISSADVVLRDAAVARALAPSRVVQIGQRPTSKALCAWLDEHAGVTALVDPDGWLLDGGSGAHRAIAADPAALCDDLSVVLERVNNGPRSPYLRRWLAADAAARGELAAHTSRDEWEGRAAKSVVDALGDGALLVAGSSMPIRDLDSFAGESARRIRVISNRGVNGIDGTVATALGASLVLPQPVVALMGDLALLHDLDGLEAASVAARGAAVRLTVVVINNGGGGIFGELPVARSQAFEQLFLTPRSARIAGLCHALGIEHREVRSAALAAALPEELEKPGIRVLEVAIDRVESSTLRKRAIERAIHAARTAIAP